MAHRLQLLQTQIASKANFVHSSFDYLQAASLLTKQQNQVRLKVRDFVEKEIIPHIHPYVDQATFPDYLLPKLKELNVLRPFSDSPLGKPLSHVGVGVICAEFARGDAGVASMLLVQWVLVIYTIQMLGSEQQKARYLPGLLRFDLVGGWGLTEQKVGSDASNIQTTVTKVKNGYKINGNKRWIGNGNRDILVVWAKNTENKNIEGYILQNTWGGISHTVIKNKLPLRIVQNCQITLDDVIAPEDSKLPRAVSFARGTNTVLKHSRIFVCWAAFGICMGVYDNVIKYVTSRKQFDNYIGGYQLVQQKVVKIMVNVQAMFLACWRISKLADQNQVTIGQIAMVKAWITSAGRDVARWGREVCGGNGIIHENYVMKAMADMEALYTYEGTYDMNTLVCGRELTGLNAFKKDSK